MIKTTLVCLLLLYYIFSTAQEVPLNPAVLHGKFGNGLTYYIQKNNQPENRASIYLVVKAGSINEEDNQNGLAHFCEHMALNGTKNFPEKSISDYLEKNGVSFGKGLNAMTTRDFTCFTLNDVPTTRETFIDTCLIILREWASNVSLETEAINRERRVIHEEWRTGGGPERRMNDITNKVVYGNTRYAFRNTIGTLEVIDSAEPELLRKFYHDFYRPDRQAVLVVGNIDPMLIKDKIASLFEKNSAPENPVNSEKIMVPDHRKLQICIATDRDAQNLTINQLIIHPARDKMDVEYLKSGMIRSLYSSMFSDRISELLQKEFPPMNFATSGFGQLTKHQDVFSVSINALSSDPLLSLKAAMTEIERIKRYGFTETEMARTKKRMLSEFEKNFNERMNTPSSELITSYMNHFISDEPAATEEYILTLAKNYLPAISINQLNNQLKIWLTDKNNVLVLQGPKKNNLKIPDEDELRNTLAEVKSSKIDPYVDKIIGNTLIDEELKGSPTINEEQVDEFGGTKLTLANGATIYIKVTENKADEILFHAFSNGGFSRVSTGDLPSAALAAISRNICGFGKFTPLDIKKLLAGKKVNLNSFIAELDEYLMGNSSVSDFETLLQLVYLNFTAPRRDDAALNSLLDRMKGMLTNRRSDPNSAFTDTLTMIMSNYNERVSILSKEYLDQIKPEKAFEIANDRFQDASDFNFIFVGNVDVQKMKPMIEKYIGSIPQIYRKEKWIDHKIGPKEGKTIKEISSEIKDQKGQVLIHYFGELACTPEYVEYLNAIQYILKMRFMETIREKEGGTYDVSVNNSLDSKPVNNYKFTIGFMCAPENTILLKELLYAEIEKFKKDGATLAEVAKTKENFMKESSEKLNNNNYIMDRMINFLNNGIYTPVPAYTTDIFSKLNGEKIRILANLIFAGNQLELMMKPAAYPSAVSTSSIKKEDFLSIKKYLTILDGIEISEEQMKSMNPQIFETMYLLNPEAALRKYGEKAMDGATVITTKYGKVPLPESEDLVYSKSEIMPEFVGGRSALSDWIKNNVKYSAEALSKGIQGKVLVTFIINQKGNVEQAGIIKSVDPLLDAEALRVVNLLPKWNPGTNRGKAVKVQFTLPIHVIP